MSSSPLWINLKGTVLSYLRLGKTGPRLKDSSGNLAVRNAADAADVSVTASQFNASSNTGLVINSDAAGSGADWKITVDRPASGMTADWTLTLPVDDGSPGQVLATDGSGATSWQTAGSTAQCLTVDTTDLVFGSSSVVTMFTLPVNAVVEKVTVIVDTAFDGTGPLPSMTVGVNGGSASQYVGSGDQWLTETNRFDVYYADPADGSTEDLEIYFTAGGGAATGAARVLVFYSVPA